MCGKLAIVYATSSSLLTKLPQHLFSYRGISADIYYAANAVNLSGNRMLLYVELNRQ